MKKNDKTDNHTQKITGYNSSRGFEYITDHFKKYNLLQKYFIEEDVGLLIKTYIIFDFIWCVLRYGCGINDYFQYKFFYKKSFDRKKFIVARKWKKIVIACNGKLKVEEFDDKSIFYQNYSEFLGRDWIDLSKAEYEEFREFVVKYPVSMYKIKDGSGGNGIGILDYNAISDLEQKYLELRAMNVILEELIIQNHEMSDFNPSSVNTLRVVTINTGKTIEIMNAVFRCGNGKGCTDNFHHLGLAALIDIDTGIVYTQAIDKKNNRYIFHPSSNKQIVGFKIPYWENVLETVKRAADVNKNIRYVGWDIAIKNNGTICIIEGNSASDPDVVQMPDQIGKWNKYKNTITKI
ncbi:sugar-transfer associated ATP-grasp domain-containing protein [Finegoldia magna]|uniref:sugar-transfer associated ATP-grasp domain-containing protein n=1 Tax=Finegoldia magna TaxID=1260 RepID=UPI001EBA6A30|nr:sugar-transfer associated ATP-grasp domain-containing protein [Finegoldia magna]MBS5359848.1 hypothetical protein [Finegoldia magna]MDU4209987.1 sugar-transfer associated ATP-grasp domain-containing protein [Finegoldia magna]MDU5507608.1 sugar-transfer associated ATP-grasp domain-containing protein [Finegoldia magna]